VRKVISYEKNLSNFNHLCSKQARKQGFIDIANSFEEIAKSDNNIYVKLKDVGMGLGLNLMKQMSSIL